jgi:hypothetical protein
MPARWHVMIERFDWSENWDIDMIQPVEADRDAARLLAGRLAREHRVSRRKKVRRSVFRMTDDTWFVRVEGTRLTSTGATHYRISVMELEEVIE